MPDPRLIAVITALLIAAGTSAARADYTLEQLQQLEQLILARDSAALGAYLLANSQLTVGDEPLARELRSFLSCATSGSIDCFDASPVLTGAFGSDGGVGLATY